MALSMVELVESKRNKWQSKIQHTKGQLLAILGRVLLVCRKKQERNGKGKRKKQKNASPSCIIKIPHELVEEILYRLPVKSLIRLKSVSKEWKSSIESGYLADKHLCLLEKKYGVVEEEMKITVQKSTSQSLCIKLFSKCGRMSSGASSKGLLRVPGSCNGLVCVHEVGSVNVYICNPMAGVVRTLTPPPQAKNKLLAGFGIDIVTGTYKVVLFYGFLRFGTVVFDFGTSEWRPTAGPMPLFCMPRLDRNPVFVNGSLFWLMAKDFSEILVMDLHTEKFRTLSTPNDMDTSLGDFYICSFEDRVCIFNFRQGVCSYVWVLVKDEVSEKWERTAYKHLGLHSLPVGLNSAWFSQTLVSPCQSSSTTCIGYRQRQSSGASAQFSGDTSLMDAPIELLHLSLN